MSRREREKEFKKQYIAEAACRLFLDSSYQAVTVEDIAREAEFGKGTLYQFFESKDDILTYILEQSLVKLCDDIKTQCLAGPDPREAFNRLIALEYRYYNDFGRLFLAFKRHKVDGVLNPQLLFRVLPKAEESKQLAAEVLERGIREQFIIPVDSNQLARAVECIVFGFILSGQAIDIARGDPDKDLELIRIVFSNGILLHQE